MINLKRLKLRAFRSFVEESEIDLSGSGLALIRGFNTGNGDSSGAGKTTIPLAISYALDFCPYPATELQSWLTEDPLQVQLDFECNGKSVSITRGKKTSISIDGNIITGAKATGEYLEKTLNIPISTLKAITYREQNSRGFFLSKTDAEKKEFLTSILGLSAFEKAIEITEENIKSLDLKLQKQQSNLALLDESVKLAQAELITDESVASVTKSAEEIRSSLVTLDNELHGWEQEWGALNDIHQQKTRSLIADINAQVCKINKELEDLVLQKKEISKEKPNIDDTLDILNSARASIEQEKEKDRQRKAEQQLALKDKNSKLSTVLNEIAHLVSLRKKLPDIEASILKLSQSTCPTCMQNWQTTEAEKEMGRLQDAASQIRTSLANIIELQNQKSQLEIDISWLSDFKPSPDIQKWIDIEKQLNTTIQDAQNSFNVTVRGKLEGISERQESLNRKLNDLKIELYRASLPPSGERVDCIKLNIETTKNRIRNLKSSLDIAEHKLTHIQQQKSVANDRFQAAKARLDSEMAICQSILTELNKERDFLRAVGREGFLGVIFDEILLEIANEANQQLAKLANVSHVTVQFKTENATQKGVIKKSITPVFYLHGHETKTLATLSGGMLTSVDLVVDLAIMAVVQRRTGTLPGWLILDEAFNGQSNNTKESCFEVLKQFSQQKLILIIDHTSEFQEMFTRFIDIECNSGFSRVK